MHPAEINDAKAKQYAESTVLDAEHVRHVGPYLSLGAIAERYATLKLERTPTFDKVADFLRTAARAIDTYAIIARRKELR